MANTTPNPLDEARRRWGTGEVLSSTPPRRARTFGLAARFTVTVQKRIPRVTEQRRDINGHRLER